MPARDVHLQFQEWAKEYGPVYSLILGTKTLVVLSSDKAVKDLLDKRSSIYSDRQEMYIGQTLCSDGLRMLMMVSLSDKYKCMAKGQRLHAQPAIRAPMAFSPKTCP